MWQSILSVVVSVLRVLRVAPKPGPDVSPIPAPRTGKTLRPPKV